MEVNEPLDPVDVGFLSAGTVMLSPDSIAYLVEEARGLGNCRFYLFVQLRVSADKCIEYT